MPYKQTLEEGKNEYREKWLEYFYKKSQNCEQKPTHLTPDTHGIIVDFLTTFAEEIHKTTTEDLVDEIRKCMPSHDAVQTKLDDLLAQLKDK